MLPEVAGEGDIQPCHEIFAQLFVLRPGQFFYQQLVKFLWQLQREQELVSEQGTLVRGRNLP